MILQHLHVNGFGVLTDLDLDFSDGLNLICGPNEAGKSTLCSYIFHMLYGMERSRGRASRFDAYVRFLPWNSAAYGGSLTFEADGETWLLERSFLAENRFLRLTRLENGSLCPDAEASLARLLGGVSETSYRAMFMMSLQSCSDLSSLSDILRQYTQNLPGSGSLNLRPDLALKSLNRQKKEAASRLSGAASGELYRLNGELSDLDRRLSSVSSGSQQDDDTDPADEFPATEPDGKRRSSLAGMAFVGIALAVLLLFAGIAGFFVPEKLPTLLLPTHLLPFLETYRVLPSLFCIGAGLIVLLLSLRRKRSSVSPDEASIPEESSFAESDAQNDASRIVAIQKLIDRQEALLHQKAELERRLSSDEALRQRIASLQLAADTISALSAELHRSLSPNLQRTFSRHASALTGRLFSHLLIDESFRVSLIENDRTVPVEALSRGTAAQLYFACRLASIQLVCPDAGLPLLLDDVFALADDERLGVLLSRLALDYPGQKLIFSCQKREAAILSQLSLSYHLIQL